MNIEIELTCERCSTYLNFKQIKDGLEIEVEPCSSCLADEYESGEQDGREQGFDDGYAAAEATEDGKEC
jgi:hypothetical protein